MASFSPYEAGGVTGGQDEEMLRKALMEQLKNNPAEPGGFAGTITDAGQSPVAAPQAAAATAPDYTQLGKYTNKMGYNMDKFKSPWDQRSEKYQIGTVLSNFDPNAGLTPEVIDALNKANIHGAKFSGSGDKLSIDNAGGYDRFGTGGTADIIQGFKNKDQDHGWGAWFVDDQGQPQLQGDGKASPAGGVGPDLTDYFSQGAGNLMDSSFLKQLMEQARGIAAPASTDRQALLSLIGGGQ